MEDTKFLLSVDGGGFRGLIPAKIVAEIERRVAEKLKNENLNSDLKCADLFDIVAGTSTGSILALSFARPNENDNRPKYDGKFMVDFFVKHKDEVFPSFTPLTFVDNLLHHTAGILNTFRVSSMASGVVNLVRKETREIETTLENLTNTSNNDAAIKTEKKTFIEWVVSIVSPTTTKNPEKEKSISKDDTKNKSVDTSKTISVGPSKSKSDDNTSIDKSDVEVDVTKTKAEHDESLVEQLRFLDDYIKSFDPLKPRYDPENFENLLTEYLGDTKLKNTANNVDVFITAFNISTYERTFFTNLNNKDDDVLMKDVVRASAAAPTYFPAKEIASKFFVDGGVFMNNPTARAYLEARRKYPKSKFVVLSLGTGVHTQPLEDHKDSGIIQWVYPLINLLMNNELVNHDDTMSILAEFDGAEYYRIQPVLKEDISLSDTKEEAVEKLLLLSDEIINNYSSKLDKVVDLLVDKVKKKNKTTA